MKIRQKTSIKHQDFLVWCYKASDDNFDKLYFPWIYLRSRIAKIYDDQNLTFLDSHRLSIFYSLKIIMISVIFLRGQTCETRKKRFLHFSDVENARNILLCNNRFMVSKYATSTLKTKCFAFHLLIKLFVYAIFLC